MAQANQNDNRNVANQNIDNRNVFLNANDINQIDNRFRVYCTRCNFTISMNVNGDTPILCNHCYSAYCDFYNDYENAREQDQNMAHHDDCLENHFDNNHGGDVNIQGDVLVCSRHHNYNINNIINSIRATFNYMNFRNM